MSHGPVSKDNFPAAAIASRDASAFASVTPLSGYLRKRARGGSWQKRWFQTRNHFLNYLKSNRHANPIAVVDLRKISEVAIVGRFGQFDLKATDGSTFSLKAESIGQASKWVNALRARMEVNHAVSDDVVFEATAPGAGPAAAAAAAPATTSSEAASAGPSAASAAGEAGHGPAPLTRLRTSGYLLKKGAQRHNWKRRFFVLTKECVSRGRRSQMPGAGPRASPRRPAR